jgi:hypothetical protein
MEAVRAPQRVYVDKKDVIYVADSQSNGKQNPGFKRVIYIGSAKDGKVTAMFPFVEPDPNANNNAGIEGIKADAQRKRLRRPDHRDDPAQIYEKRGFGLAEVILRRELQSKRSERPRLPPKLRAVRSRVYGIE